MLRIDRRHKELFPLTPRKLADVGILEREDLQRMILQSAEAFFGEMGETLKIFGEEVRPADYVADRIDILALDPDGSLVVIELKRANHKLHLLQVLSYAAMVSKWSPDRLIEQFQRGNSPEEARAEVEDFLEEGNFEDVNRTQRVILLAEEFDFQVLTTAEWLYEEYKLDIRCYRISLAKHDDNEFLTCNRIYPPPELTDQAKGRPSRLGASRPKIHDWPTALQRIENPAVKAFFEGEVEAGRDGNPDKRRLLFNIGPKVRYAVWAKKAFASVVQRGRFDEDEKFWSSRLELPNEVRPINGGIRLRFRLRTDRDFQSFKQALDKNVQPMSFLSSSVQEDAQDIEDETDE